jgi:DNA-binding NarL/FixJ family response regulator
LGKTKVLLVEDFGVMRLGLSLALNDVSSLEVIAESDHGEEAVRVAVNAEPDLVLMDIGLPGINGIEAVRRIKEKLPKTRIIMLTSHEDGDDILASFGAGADGYCLKDVDFDQLITAINTVMSGEWWIDPRLSQRALSQASKNRTHLPLVNSSQKTIPPREVQTEAARGGRKESLEFPGRQQPVHEEKVEVAPFLRQSGSFDGRYQMQCVIGSGGTGIVYKAKHVYMERTVAIKVLSDVCAQNLKLVKRFQLESQAASALKHKNIITIYDFGVTNSGQPFLVMDYVKGKSLEEVLKEKADGPPSNEFVAELVGLFLQVCDGLSATHDAGIVHCDLKPSNIMLEGYPYRSNVVLVDFGLARAHSNEPDIQLQDTDTFEVAGSPLYMSPEQCHGLKLDLCSDIYSLGCIMYESFTRQPVFSALTIWQLFQQHTNDMPKSFAEVCPGVEFPAGLEELVMGCLQKSPEDRIKSVAEIRQRLAEISVS